MINLLLARVRYGGNIALAVASSGIAATLLVEGRTAHSTFKLPLKYDSDDATSVSNVSKQSDTGELMQDCSLTLTLIILTGCGSGKTVFLPRIPIIPSDLPFHFKRIQFPLKLAFAMTINKAQGQTLHVTGIHLSVQYFFHV